MAFMRKKQSEADPFEALQITAEQAIANGNSHSGIAAQGDWLTGGAANGRSYDLERRAV